MSLHTGAVEVLVVVSDPVERDGVTACVAGDGIRLTGQVGTAEEACALLQSNGRDQATVPQVVLVDFRLTGLSGAAAVTVLRETAPQARVVVLSEHATAPVMLSAFGAGAHGLVIKDSEPDVFEQAVHDVVDGGTFVDPQVVPELVEMANEGKRAAGPYDLTRQQLRVLNHLAEGLTNRQIAEQLVLSAETIKSHVREIMNKVGVHNRAELAKRALDEGLV